MRKYLVTARMTFSGIVGGGIANLYIGYALRLASVAPLMLIWPVLFASGADTGGLAPLQMLTYTYMGAIFADLLNIRTQASEWFYAGIIIDIYMRPMGVLSHLAAQSFGSIAPVLLFYTAPMLIVAPLFGISLIPATMWFIPSLVLCVSLGFAVEFIFACITIRMINVTWQVYQIRAAITGILSGALIPFAALPWGIGRVLQILPFGSLAGAPLSLFCGLAEPLDVLSVQFFWNLLLWPCALHFYSRSRERMVSHGG